MIKLISIDSSTKKTGVAYFENGSLKKYFLLESSNSDVDVRFCEIVKQLYDVLNEYMPDIVWIEDTWNANNIQTTKVLSKLIGTVYGWCIVKSKEFHTILPSEWRKYCGISQSKMKRAELKQASIAYVKNRYDIDVNDDVADAISMGDGIVNYFQTEELFE